MSKILISPGRYVQGPGAIHEIGSQIKSWGSKTLVLGGKNGLASVRKSMENSLAKAGLEACFESFGGECSRIEIDRITAIVKEKSIGIIIGVGGGKALDTAKAVAYYARLPVAVVPTIAATDAPCSALV